MATYTTNLQLPLFEPGDRVDLISIYNAAMQLIDSFSLTVATSGEVATIAAQAAAAQSDAAAAQTSALAAQNSAAAVQAAIDENGATPLDVTSLSTAVVTQGRIVKIPAPVPAQIEPTNSGEVIEEGE